MAKGEGRVTGTSPIISSSASLPVPLRLPPALPPPFTLYNRSTTLYCCISDCAGSAGSVLLQRAASEGWEAASEAATCSSGSMFSSSSAQVTRRPLSLMLGEVS
jgi:hypothetical protein